MLWFASKCREKGNIISLSFARLREKVDADAERRQTDEGTSAYPSNSGRYSKCIVS